MNDALFRKEAVDHSLYRFASTPLTVSPLSFTALSLFVFLVSVALVLFVVVGRYSPKDTVRGYVVTTTGGVEVYAPSDGMILALLVNEGDVVAKGQQLLTLATSRAAGDTGETIDDVIEGLRQEKEGLRLQAARESDVFEVQEQGVKDEIKSLRNRLLLLAGQRAELQRGLKLSRRALERLTALEASEFVSSKDLDAAQSTVVEYSLRLRELDLLTDGTRSEIRGSENRLLQLPVQREARAAEFLVKENELGIRITENKARDTQRVLAPVDGVVSGLLVRNGQTISPNRPLLSIVPENGNYYAEVVVPTRTIAFVRPDMDVQIRYDAYPYQKFGTHKGVVDSVSRTTVLPTDKRFRISITEPVYLARVRILHQGVEAYGELQPLQSGMTLTADIFRDQRRLVEWIFDPLVGATRRL